MRECECERVTFEHKHENKSCSACRETVNERLKECESERVFQKIPGSQLLSDVQIFFLLYQNGLSTRVRAVTLIIFREFSKYSLIFLLNFPPKIRIFSEYVFPSSTRRHDSIVVSLLSHETQNNNVLTNVTFATMSEKIIRFGLQQDKNRESME